jgi:hypothetical protein
MLRNRGRCSRHRAFLKQPSFNLEDHRPLVQAGYLLQLAYNGADWLIGTGLVRRPRACGQFS